MVEGAEYKLQPEAKPARANSTAVWMSTEYIEFDEIEDVLASTDLLADIIPRVSTNPLYWK